MELGEILIKLQSTIDRLKISDEYSFVYNVYVVGDLDIYLMEYGIIEEIQCLSKKFELSECLVKVLFFGLNIESTFTDCFKNHKMGDDYTLDDVIQRFVTVYELLKNKQITPDWNPYESDLLYYNPKTGIPYRKLKQL
jgi:hypothetical protein